MWAEINFISLVLAFLGLAVLYLISLQPKKRETRLGEKVWKQSKNLRTAGFICEALGMGNIILWHWAPLDAVNWPILADPAVALVIGIILAVPCLIIMSIGVIQVGEEAWEPQRPKLYDGGLYHYVRHPQAITEFPLFAIMALGVNSWFLLGLLALYNVVYLPIMRKIEEEDLILRFGDEYRAYQSRTGAFFPKLARN